MGKYTIDDSVIKSVEVSKGSLANMTRKRKEFEKQVIQEREKKYVKSYKWYAISMKWMKAWLNSLGSTLQGSD